MNDQNEVNDKKHAEGQSLLNEGLGAWLPIETAPKNQIEIIIFAPDETPNVFTAKFIYGWDRSSSGEYKPNDDFYGDGEINATHWMPLPQAPN